MAIVKNRNPKGSVSYVVRVRDRNGSWFPSKSFARKVDAESHERSLLSERDRLGLTASPARRDLLVRDYTLLWASEYRSRVSDGWKMSQDQLLRDHILPFIGNMKMSEVQAPDIGKVLRRMETKGLGPQQRRHVYNLLSQIFDRAAEYDQIILVNPVSKRDRPDVMAVERTSLKPEQARQLLQVAKGDPIAAAVWIAVLAGLRTSEVQGLTWGAVDFEKSLLHINQAFKRKTGVMEPYPKQKKRCSSPMMPALKEYLLPMSTGKLETELVVSRPGNVVMANSALTDGLKRLCRKAGLPVVTPHELRHSCTELWLESGATEEDIIRLLNHSGASSVRRYIHKSPDRLLRIGQTINIEPTQKKARPNFQIVR
jgi:integrase